MNIELGTLYYLKLFVTDSVGEPVSGQINTYIIYSASSDTIVDSGTLTDIGNGIYSGSYTFDTLGQYYIIYDTPSGFQDVIEQLEVINVVATESNLNTIDSNILSIFSIDLLSPVSAASSKVKLIELMIRLSAGILSP